MSDRWTKMFVAVLALLAMSLAVWAVAAGWGTRAEAAVAVRYEITADSGEAWMVDSATGRVWYCDEGSCRELPVANLHPRPGG
jgi:hypothetical protein